MIRLLKLIFLFQIQITQDIQMKFSHIHCSTKNVALSSLLPQSRPYSRVCFIVTINYWLFWKKKITICINYYYLLAAFTPWLYKISEQWPICEPILLNCGFSHLTYLFYFYDCINYLLWKRKFSNYKE